MITSIYCSLAAYTIGFILKLIGDKPFLPTLCVGIGLAANLIVVSGRYCEAWPMMPMHLGIAGLSAVLSIIWLCSYGAISKKMAPHRDVESRYLLAIVVLIIFATLFFPKDFYLPFLTSNIIWSHIFLLSGIIAKSCLIHGGVKAIGAIHHNRMKINKPKDLTSATNWIVYGYGFLTVSLFSGELWCYLGWGTPVVWHDAAITTVLALWLYWTCFLHLHYISSWNRKRRALFIVTGAALVLLYGCHPDMGPFRLPFPIRG